MKHTLPILTMVLGLALGAVAGHYHGKATVYGAMFDHQAMLAEMINE